MLNVIYDGQCSFCVRALKVCGALDMRRALCFHDATARQQVHTVFPELLRADFDNAMFAVAPGRRVTRGFFAFRSLLWESPLLWPLLLVFYFPGASWIGPNTYAWVAKNRRRFDCKTANWSATRRITATRRWRTSTRSVSGRTSPSRTEAAATGRRRRSMAIAAGCMDDADGACCHEHPEARATSCRWLQSRTRHASVDRRRPAAWAAGPSGGRYRHVVEGHERCPTTIRDDHCIASTLRGHGWSTRTPQITFVVNSSATATSATAASCGTSTGCPPSGRGDCWVAAL